jgi:hypothetical protein
MIAESIYIKLSSSTITQGSTTLTWMNGVQRRRWSGVSEPLNGKPRVSFFLFFLCFFFLLPNLFFFWTRCQFRYLLPQCNGVLHRSVRRKRL